MHNALNYAQATLASVDCPRSLALYLMCKAGDWEGALRLPLVPTDYPDAESYFLAAQAHAFLSSNVDIPGASQRSREDACFDKWLKAEQQCCKTNARLSPYLHHPSSEDVDERVLAVLSETRKIIRGVIGPCPPQHFQGKFGPGATVSNNSQHSTVPDKLASAPTFTTGAFGYLVPWAGTAWATSVVHTGQVPRQVRGNVYFTVPKNALSDRPCGKEPSLNGFYQLGLGKVIRQRLKANAGIDLRRGQLIHGVRVKHASLSGLFATIDLSSASDTLCRNLVRLLLPPMWFEALNDLRSPTTQVGSKTYFLEKFSSMGNGFTFELETLVFWALSCAVSDLHKRADISVYGDDIIVPTECADDVVAALRFFGFTPNDAKTFTSGPFRESCGEDYYHGVRVRPHFQDVIPSKPIDYISFLNGLRRASKGRLIPGIPRLRKMLVNSLPLNLRLYGPEELGDIVIHSDRWVTRWRGQLGYVRTYKPVRPRYARVNGFADATVLAAAVYGAVCDRPWQSYGAFKGTPDSCRGWSLRTDPVYRVGWTNFS